jgi:DnaK suppressor protein
MIEGEKAAMNASGLTAGQLEILRQRLEHLRAELQARLEREEQRARETDRLTEPMDAAELTREQDDAVTFSEHDRIRLRDVEHALAKLENGTYGVSEASGRPIGFRRLLAVPWARVAADEADVTA